MTNHADNLARLRELIAQSSRMVAFTGAGISTESGIPDFRSPGGLWTKYRPIEFQDFMASEEMRRESWHIKFATEKVIADAKPNKGHLALAHLYRQGKLSSVITQNIDGLHQVSGIPDDRVIELHGNTTYALCLDCHQRYELDQIRAIFLPDETVPHCDRCGGFIKTATISFGQAMPVEEMRRAEEETLACDLFVALGSSLVVFPAAGFPLMAKQNGARLVIINRDATKQDPYADLVINGSIGEVLGGLLDGDELSMGRDD
ncbi:SIR2 family NAD-dependent protein deacylase [Desulfatitalea alkaliphila]|uniref:protein acetyllysine N-acetyltransferase n=1 Tax=Desulfatitalea alkaliphila TaxID=2929485 RepID=A0AA41R2R1_9BACT|nr:Sir2 family NAD-dependent protein deacetylase [Desulfatitalea alkaliphila]MCJ8500616.1 Sir2 family NAD-dependent protein deacetylase [Desulfatitalea alkaliphila]